MVAFFPSWDRESRRAGSYAGLVQAAVSNPAPAPTSRLRRVTRGDGRPASKAGRLTPSAPDRETPSMTNRPERVENQTGTLATTAPAISRSYRTAFADSSVRRRSAWSSLLSPPGGALTWDGHSDVQLWPRCGCSTTLGGELHVRVVA